MILPFELLIFELLGDGKAASEMIYLEPNTQRMLKSRGGRVCWLISEREQQLSVVPNNVEATYSPPPLYQRQGLQNLKTTVTGFLSIQHCWRRGIDSNLGLNPCFLHRPRNPIGRLRVYRAFGIIAVRARL